MTAAIPTILVARIRVAARVIVAAIRRNSPRKIRRFRVFRSIFKTLKFSRQDDSAHSGRHSIVNLGSVMNRAS